MPSKSKKSSKASSNSEYSASRQTPTLTSSSADSDFSKQNLHVLLEEASSIFPNLIGKSAFIGSLTNVRNSRHCTIWLSESSMGAYSISPGSFVTVSLAASTVKSIRTFPLISFLDELTADFKLEFMDETTSKTGDYFALATVFPSSEVAKNGVMLSSSLSYTMGCPASGSVIFVYPVEVQLPSDTIYGNIGPQNSKTYGFPIHICSELFLELIPAERIAKYNGDLKPRVNSFEELHCESENINSWSPKTPPSQPKINSTPSRQPCARRKAASTLPYPNITSVDFFDVEETLKDEVTKQLLQGCAASAFRSRALIHGNIVAFQVLSKITFFHVMGINRLVAGSDQDLMKEKRTFSVVDDFNGFFFVNHKTKVNLSAAETPRNRAGLHPADSNIECDVSKLGGLGEEYATIRDIISSSMKKTLMRDGLPRATKGILLHGPPGTGKTTLARLCVRDAGVNLFVVNGPEIYSQYHGESLQAMQNVFQIASQAAPAVVFIDELDAIAPAMGEGGEALSQQMVVTLLNLMDGISRTDGLLVIAATNRLECIDGALKRAGRFREIKIDVPSPKQRLDILQTLLSVKKHSLSPKEIGQLASHAHGFVGADLVALCNEAAIVCLKRSLRSKEICNSIHLKKSSILREDKTSDCSVGTRDIFRDSNGTESTDSLKISSSSFCIAESLKEKRNSSIDSTETLFANVEHSLEISFEDFEKAKLKVRPSDMREVYIEVPKVNWEDVGGQVEVKNQLKETVLLSEKSESAWKRIGVTPPTGFLLCGPPGCSKTLMARAVASEANQNFLAVKGPELFSKWVGESEKNVRSVFAKAKANAPSIIFFDEIDGLAAIRGKEDDGVSVSDRVLTQLLTEMDGMHKRVDVTVIAATNRPDKLDPALTRPGRFDRVLYVGPPNEIDREDVFRIYLRKAQCSSDVSIKELASLTEGYTGADIRKICSDAVIMLIEETDDDDLDKLKVTMQHLKTVISQVRPTKTHVYEELCKSFQRVVVTPET